MIKFIDEKEAIEKYGKGLETPVLYTVFNRIDLVEKAFGQIKKVKPKKLYIAQDGPREHVEGDKEKVLAVRDYILSNIDWDCEFKTLFREKNLGLDKAMLGAIDWFFENEEQGIVIEEDVYMSLSGFYFLENMLNKFKYDKYIWFVNSTNIVDTPYDYFKTDRIDTHGYGIWKYKWKNIKFGDKKDLDFLDKYFENKRVAKFCKAFMSPPKDRLRGYYYDSEIQMEILPKNAYAISPKLSLNADLGFSHSTHVDNSGDAFKTETLYKYYLKIENIKEIDVDALEDYTETPIIKTFEKSHIIFESFSIFTAITSDKAETNLKNIVSTYKKIAVYGAGMLGYLLYAIYDDLLSDKVCCFLDDDPKDVELMGKPIIKPQDMSDDVDLVIISPHSKKAYENMKEKVAGKKAIWLRDLVF